MKIARLIAVLVLLVSAAFAGVQTQQGTTFNAPVTLITDGPEKAKTNDGHDFTQTIYGASLQNDDTYLVAISEYPFQTDNSQLDAVINGFTNGVGGEVKQSQDVTIAGLAGRSAVVETVKNGHTMRFYLAVVFKGNKAYVYAFGTWMDTQGTDISAVKTFFQSISIQ